MTINSVLYQPELYDYCLGSLFMVVVGGTALFYIWLQAFMVQTMWSLWEFFSLATAFSCRAEKRMGESYTESSLNIQSCLSKYMTVSVLLVVLVLMLSFYVLLHRDGTSRGCAATFSLRPDPCKRWEITFLKRSQTDTDIDNCNSRCRYRCWWSECTRMIQYFEK